MLGINQLDFMSYATALKSNYRKGIRRLEAILSNPTHAAEFAANLGGVSVVLGVPIGREDRNSEALLSLLLNSDIADDAVLTWMHQFYEFTTWDDLMGNSARVQEMMQNPFLWRALGGSKKAVGKGVATLAGLSCVSYADIDAVVASSTAMTAVAASQTAMAAMAASQTAMAAVATSQTAMAAIQKSQTAKDAIAASSMATAKYAAGAAGLNPADYADMTVLAASSTAMAAVATSQTAMAAIVASPTAMAAIWRSNSAVAAVQKNTTAWKTFTGATSAVMGKTVAILANLNPADYADMTAVAASQTAMAAVIGNATALNAVVSSQTAMAAVAASQTAMAAVIGNATALNAVVSSSTAMTAVIGNATALNAVVSSSTAMTAVAASSTARAAICASDVAFNHLLSLATYDTISGTTSGSGWSTRYSKPCIALQWCYSYQSGTSGIRTCLDGNASRQYTGSQRYNSSINSSNYNDHEKKPGTYYKEFVFCSKLETYNSQSDWPAISIAYFKLP